ncbi:MAG: hypothetical protein ACTHKQ_21805, partial [Mesorhizobium sp.]
VRDKQFAPASKKPLKSILMSVTFYRYIGPSYGVCVKFPNLSVRLRLFPSKPTQWIEGAISQAWTFRLPP